MTTVRELIEGSLRLIEQLGAGESAGAEDAADCLEALSMMIGSWSGASDLIFAETTDNLTLTAGDGIYTIGATGDFAVSRPVRIVSAYITNGTTDTALNIIDARTYAAIPVKTTQGTPDSIYLESNFPNATIKLYPVPSGAYTLNLVSEKPLTEYTALTTTLSLPPGYERALKYNLAIEIAPEFGKDVRASVMSTAIESKNTIMAANNRYDNDKLSVDSALLGGGDIDIFTRS